VAAEERVAGQPHDEAEDRHVEQEDAVADPPEVARDRVGQGARVAAVLAEGGRDDEQHPDDEVEHILGERLGGGGRDQRRRTGQRRRGHQQDAQRR
jgi:hypothetical protein